jgi:excisionase family DNA binding protein
MTDPTDVDEWMTTTEAAARLGIEPYTVAERAKAGRIRAEKVGRFWRIDPAEVERIRTERYRRHGDADRPLYRPRTRR